MTKDNESVVTQPIHGDHQIQDTNINNDVVITKPSVVESDLLVNGKLVIATGSSLLVKGRVSITGGIVMQNGSFLQTEGKLSAGRLVSGRESKMVIGGGLVSSIVEIGDHTNLLVEGESRLESLSMGRAAIIRSAKDLRVDGPILAYASSVIQCLRDLVSTNIIMTNGALEIVGDMKIKDQWEATIGKNTLTKFQLEKRSEAGDTHSIFVSHTPV